MFLSMNEDDYNERLIGGLADDSLSERYSGEFWRCPNCGLLDIDPAEHECFEVTQAENGATFIDGVTLYEDECGPNEIR